MPVNSREGLERARGMRVCMGGREEGETEVGAVEKFEAGGAGSY